jgi:integrase
LPWSHSIGERPNTVRVFERRPGGIIYAALWDPTAAEGEGHVRTASLGHRNKREAIRFAKEQYEALVTGSQDIASGRFTLAQIFMLYEQNRTEGKVASEQQADRRRVELWSRWLGGGCDPHKITMQEWEGFIKARRSGAIDPRGKPVPVKKNQRPVRARTVEADCVFLHLVFNWAAKWRLKSGSYLMRENPVRGFAIPREHNPLQPVATQDRFEKVRAVSDRVQMENRWQGKREVQRSYLSELLDIVDGTGRRIRAVCHLEFQDLRLERTKETPYGAISWPARTDKKRKLRVVPISPTVRAALDRIIRERAGIGSTPLFPSPTDRAVPISRHLADAWLREAEQLAGVPSLEGGLWHPYRRKWATERKHLPAVDVAQAGGWEDTDTMRKCYQKADPATMLQVILGGGELREII